MRKWLMRLSTITIVVLLLNSHQGLIDSVSNFMVDGVVPFSNISLSGILSVVPVILVFYFICKSIANLRFEMLKRSAILYTQAQQTDVAYSLNAKSLADGLLAQAEDLELIQNSL